MECRYGVLGKHTSTAQSNRENMSLSYGRSLANILCECEVRGTLVSKVRIHFWETHLSSILSLISHRQQVVAIYNIFSEPFKQLQVTEDNITLKIANSGP